MDGPTSDPHPIRRESRNVTDAERQPDRAQEPGDAQEVDAHEVDQPAASEDQHPGADGDLAPEADTASPDEADAVTEHLDLEAVADADPRSKGEVLGELIAAETKRDEYLDDLRRSHADFENYRKRVMREGTAQREAGKIAVVESLLEVLDDLDLTLEAATRSPDAGLAKGVALVADKLGHALDGVGLTRIDETGGAFDPTQHEAVQQIPAEESRDEPVVAQVLRPGYRLGDRVLRAAMVVVEQ